MKTHALHTLLFIGLGLLALNVNAQLDTQAEDSRSSRQSDFDFPGPRRQTPATLPVFHSGGGGRGRPRPFDSGEGEVIDEGFQEPQLPPPRQSFRGSGGSSSEGSRFSRPQFSEDLGNEADPGGRVKGQSSDGGQEEKKEPEVDRLALLLQESKFSCGEKKPGYYADDGLSCEVFHYCNEGVRHSWMCPAGTSFHQIHLICMQEGGDNICKQSTKYHFVNDYLYKPVSQATKENNGTIRYADRYFPDEGGNPNQDNANDGFQRDQPQHQSGQDDFSNFQEPSQGGFRPSRPQSEEQFFAPPPQRPSHDGGSRFRPSFDEGQFSPEPSQFSSGSRGRPQQHDDLRAFGSDDGTSFQPAPAPARVRGRPGKRNQGFPTFSES